MNMQFELDHDGYLIGPRGQRVTEVDVPTLALDGDKLLDSDCDESDADDGLTLMIAEVLTTMRLRQQR